MDRYERAATVHAIEEAADDPLSGREPAKAVMEADVQALR
jgi:hypothetical protein